MILFGIIVVIFTDIGYLLALTTMGFSLLVYAIKTLIFYGRMARHMVGGKSMLYTGVIALDLAVFTLSMSSMPPAYLVLYLVAVYAFTGVINILRGIEAKKFGSNAWIIKFIAGLIYIFIAVAAVVSGLLFRSLTIPVSLYGSGIISAGITRLVSAFRKTEVVYIQ